MSERKSNANSKKRDGHSPFKCVTVIGILQQIFDSTCNRKRSQVPRLVAGFAQHVPSFATTDKINVATAVTDK